MFQVSTGKVMAGAWTSISMRFSQLSPKLGFVFGELGGSPCETVTCCTVWQPCPIPLPAALLQL